MAELVRLNRFLASGLGISRRQADELIAAGKVLVNDEVPVLGARVRVGATDGSSSGSGLDKIDKVCHNGKIVPFLAKYTYLAMNKPVGYVCSRRGQGAPTIYDLLPAGYRDLKTVGRLDKDSSGLILLTNDGDFAHQMTHPKFAKTKIYEVRLDKPLAPLHQQEIADFGIKLPDGMSRLGLTRLDDSRKFWQVTMSEGRNRQIRRTFGALGYEVVGLHRVQFGKYQLAKLKPANFVEVLPA